MGRRKGAEDLACAFFAMPEKARDLVGIIGIVGTRRPFVCTEIVQYVTAEWELAFLRQAREFPFFPLLPREPSK